MLVEVKLNFISAVFLEWITRRPANTGIFFAQLQIFLDQFLQTFKNKITVLILVFKEFLPINSTTDFCTLCKKVSRFSLEKFLSHSAEKFRRGTCLCFRKSLVPKNVRNKRGGVYHDFPLKLFCLTVPKNFVGEPFGVSENFWYRKILCFRGLCHDFPSKIFCLKVPKNFVEQPFCAVFQKISGSEKVYG